MALRSDHSQRSNRRVPLRRLVAGAWQRFLDRRYHVDAFDKEQRKHYNYFEVLALWAVKTHKSQSPFVPTAASHIPKGEDTVRGQEGG